MAKTLPPKKEVKSTPTISNKKETKVEAKVKPEVSKKLASDKKVIPPSSKTTAPKTTTPKTSKTPQAKTKNTAAVKKVQQPVAKKGNKVEKKETATSTKTEKKAVSQRTKEIIVLTAVITIVVVCIAALAYKLNSGHSH